MDRYCPECNSNMTPSLVGYLCVNCGHVQRFYSAGESALATPKNLALPTGNHKKHNEVKPSGHKSPKGSANKSQNKVKTTLKRLMVPELAPPHHHIIGEGDDLINPVLADRIEDEQPKPTMLIADSSNEQVNKVPTQDEIKVPDNSSRPNQSSNLSELQSALHPQRNTSIWVMLGLALLMLIFAAAVLFLIILS